MTFAWSAAAAVENARDLAGYCQSLERGAKGAGPHIYIPRTSEALTCWGYMRIRALPALPAARITLRQGARVVMKTWTE